MSEIVQPLGSRVLVRVMLEESRTASGLVIPDTAKEKPQRGDVVAVGDDADLIKVAVGDRVLFSKYTGTEIRVADADHLIIESLDLLAILRDEPADAAAA
jgi:chaperonin GroES